MKKYAEDLRSALHARWVSYAARQGATLYGSFPDVTLRGVRNGMPYAYYQSASLVESYDADGKHRDWEVRAEAIFHDPELLGSLFVEAEHLGHRIGKFFGAQDLVLGDAEFDRLYVVKDRDEAHARRLLTPRAREAFVQAHKQGRTVILINQELLERTTYPAEDPELVDALIHQVTWIASLLGK